ncbi:MAG: CHAD domain-containing protein [Kiritimatiellales bacterium]
MACRSKKTRQPIRSLRNILESELDRAVCQILAAGRKNPDGIHEVRKSLKKVRAVLRLVQTDLGKKRYRAQDRLARDTARCLSVRRDDEVLFDTFARLTAPLSDNEKSLLRSVQDQLVDRKNSARRLPFLDRLCSLAGLLRLRHMIRKWPAVTKRSVSKGWKKEFKKACRAWQLLEQDRSSLQVHEWRKRVKIHAYHMFLLADGDSRKRRDPLHELSDLLGRFHDLTVFREQLSFQPPAFGTAFQASMLDSLAEAEQARLLAAARPLGKMLFSEKPRRMAKSIKKNL